MLKNSFKIQKLVRMNAVNLICDVMLMKHPDMFEKTIDYSGKISLRCQLCDETIANLMEPEDIAYHITRQHHKEEVEKLKVRKFILKLVTLYCCNSLLMLCCGFAQVLQQASFKVQRRLCVTSLIFNSKLIINKSFETKLNCIYELHF